MGVERDKVTPDTSLLDLRADDLDFVELIMVLEEEFNIAVPDDQAEALPGTENWSEGMKNVTMQKLADLVDERRRAKGAKIR